MRRITLLLSASLLSIAAHAQKAPDYAATDKKMTLIPKEQTTTTRAIADYVAANFATDAEKARAIFIWTATNIQYDVDNMFAINFYEKREDKIAKALATHKGICENYATVFTDICNKAGLTAYVVEGYTKQNGFTDYIPHAWCAAKLDTTWYLFDPTWGSGYISNQKFVKKINNDYFKVKPSVLVKSHIPFDRLWQFSYYPVSVQDFYENKTQLPNKARTFFSYPDSIAAYNRESEPEQLAASARRVEEGGVRNSLIYDRLAHLKRALEIDKQNEQINAQNENVTNYNTAAADYNNAVRDLNAFIDYRNKQFSPSQPDTTIQKMVDRVDGELKSARIHLALIKHADATNANLILSINKSIDELEPHVDEQKEFVKKYLSKGTFGRKTMFTKYTWMGMPLN